MGIITRIKSEKPGIIKQIVYYHNGGQFGEYPTEFAMGLM